MTKSEGAQAVVAARCGGKIGHAGGLEAIAEVCVRDEEALNHTTVKTANVSQTLSKCQPL